MRTYAAILLALVSFRTASAQELSPPLEVTESITSSPVATSSVTDAVNLELLSDISSESPYFNVSAAFLDRLATTNSAADVLELEGWSLAGISCDTGPEFSAFSCVSCLDDDDKKKLKELYERLRDTTKQLVDTYEASLKNETEKLEAIKKKLDATADGRKWLELQDEILDLNKKISRLKRQPNPDPKEFRAARSKLAIARGNVLLVEATLGTLPKEKIDQENRVSEAKVKLADAEADLERYEWSLMQLDGMSACTAISDPVTLERQVDYGLEDVAVTPVTQPATNY